MVCQAFKKLLIVRGRKSLSFDFFLKEEKISFVNKVFDSVVDTGIPFEGNIELIKANKKSIYCDVFISRVDECRVLVELKDASTKEELQRIREDHDHLRSQQL